MLISILKVLFLVVILLVTTILIAKIISSILCLIYKVVKGFVKGNNEKLKGNEKLVGIRFKSKFEVITFLILAVTLCAFVGFYIYNLIVLLPHVSYSDTYKLAPVNKWLFYMLKDITNY